MKNNILTYSIITLLSTIMIANAQEHPFLTKNVNRYPAPKAQNESTFQKMLPEKPLSKSNGFLLHSIVKTNSLTQVNELPEIPPSKRNYTLPNRLMVISSQTNGNSLPKLPPSKMNYYDPHLRK